MRAFAIVPAAGKSRRMGQPKLLLPWRGATVIAHLLHAWRSSRVERVVVVVRRGDEDLLAAIRHSVANDSSLSGEGGSEASDAGRPLAAVDLVLPPVDPPDMKDSVRAALEHIEQAYRPTGDDVWLLAPADTPTLSTSVIDGLLAAVRSPQTSILVPTAGGRRGHPSLFSFRLASAVANLSEQEGVNAILGRELVEEVELGTGALAPDFDTPDEYARLVERSGLR